MGRFRGKVMIGDGGDSRLVAGMRAQANFVEYAPFVLILMGLIELGGGSAFWLWIAGGAFILARIGHGWGMMRPAPNIGRAGVPSAPGPSWRCWRGGNRDRLCDAGCSCPDNDRRKDRPLMTRLPLIGLAALMLTAPLTAAAPDPISPQRLSADVKTLASDAFEGRAPGTPGETKTVDWLVAQFKAMGLQPGGPNGQWTQSVPLIRTQIGQGTMRAGAMPLVQGQGVYVSTVRPVDRVAIKDAPMVFVGYGVHAPERGWDDFKGVDLKGKIAVFLVNDPDFEAMAGDDAKGRFGDRRMTYYGRWTYKYEEAARQGAIGALIVHDTAGAGYGWATVTAPAGENYDIVRSDPTSRILLQGWLSGESANRLFAAAGLDLAQQRARPACRFPAGGIEGAGLLRRPARHHRPRRKPQRAGQAARQDAPR
ncbi:hypothetical protein GCM10020258_16180 [Sphingomonas yabuuchiae]